MQTALHDTRRVVKAPGRFMRGARFSGFGSGAGPDARHATSEQRLHHGGRGCLATQHLPDIRRDTPNRTLTRPHGVTPSRSTERARYTPEAKYPR